MQTKHGSPESYIGILIELDNFANNSGLRINFTLKQKLSKDVFHYSRLKLA